MVFSVKTLKLSEEVVTLSFLCNANGFNNIFNNNKSKEYVYDICPNVFGFYIIGIEEVLRFI